MRRLGFRCYFHIHLIIIHLQILFECRNVKKHFCMSIRERGGGLQNCGRVIDGCMKCETAMPQDNGVVRVVASPFLFRVLPTKFMNIYNCCVTFSSIQKLPQLFERNSYVLIHKINRFIRCFNMLCNTSSRGIWSILVIDRQ